MVGAQIQWLRKKTRDQKVVSSNPGTDGSIFGFICCKIDLLGKTGKIEEETGVGPFFKR